MIIDWTPDDGSPTYRLECDIRDGSFVRVVDVFDVVPARADARRLPVPARTADFVRRTWQSARERQSVTGASDLRSPVMFV